MKRIEKDGKFFRIRRGKIVEIPSEWVGKVTTPKTIRQRKLIAKIKKNKKAHRRKGQGEFCA